MYGARSRYDFASRPWYAFRGWGYQDFAAGVITDTSVTLTNNENGTSADAFSSSNIINSTAVICRLISGEPTAKKPRTGTALGLLSTAVTVSAHTGAAVTLSGVPHSTHACRIYYFYNYQYGAPLNYTIPSKAVAGSLFAELQDLLITEEEIGDGSKDAVFNSIENTPIGASLPSSGAFGTLTSTTGTIGQLSGTAIDFDSGVFADLGATDTFTGNTGTFIGTLTGATLVSGSLTLASGSITDTSGRISFGDETLETTEAIIAGRFVDTDGNFTATGGAVTGDTATFDTIYYNTLTKRSEGDVEGRGGEFTNLTVTDTLTGNIGNFSGALTGATITGTAIEAGVTDYDKFLVSASGVIKYRTGTEVLSDMGVTASAAELNVLDGVNAGTVAASKGVVVDASKNIGAFGTITAGGFTDTVFSVASGVFTGVASIASGELTVTSGDTIKLCPNDDDDDYLVLQTVDDVPEITTVGTCELKLSNSLGTPRSVTISEMEDAHDHSQVAGGNSVHVSVAENTAWDAKADYSFGANNFSGTGTFTTLGKITKEAHADCSATFASDVEILSDATNDTANPAGLSVEFDTDQSSGTLFVAGYFKNNTSGTWTEDNIYYGLYGGCTPALTASETNYCYIRGLDFLAANTENVAGGDLYPDYRIYGAVVEGRLGYTGKTISGNLYPCELYGLKVLARTYGTLNASYLGVADAIGNIYGVKVEMDDNFSVTDGDFHTYGLHITAMSGIGGAGVGWGIYQASDVINAIHGKLRIGSVATPTEALHFADACNIAFDTTTGTEIGTAAGQKLSFYGATPVAQNQLATGAGKTVDEVITELQRLGLVRQAA